MPKSSLIILLSLLLAAIVWAEEGVSVETAYDATGNLQVKYVTPGFAGIVDQTNPPAHYGVDQMVLWMDDHATSIAEHMAISGNGNYAAAGWWLNVERTAKYAVTGSGVPIWEYTLTPNFKMPVAISDDGNVIASTGDIIPLSVWLNGAGPDPSWQVTAPAGYNSYGCAVADNGSRVAVVYKSLTVNDGILKIFNSSGGAAIAEFTFDAQNGANGVALSEAGDWAVVSTYYHEYVFDLTSMTLFWTGNNYGQGMAAIDADAEWLAKGDFNGNLTVFHRNPTGYAQSWVSYFGGWVTAVAVSADGSTVLGGNMLFNPYRGIARGFDISGTMLFEYSQYGDEVGMAALSNDGSVGAVACWGQYGGTLGDVFTAFDMSTGAVIFNLLDDIDEPGSIFCVDVSDDGSYAVCGGKAVHAREFGNGGEAYCIELAEPGPFDIEITMTPDTLPIIIPAAGGSFDYTVLITNMENTTVSFRAWTEALLPGGMVYGPILDRNVTLPGGGSLTRNLTQTVPAGAPAGNYQYCGVVGTLSGTVWNVDTFPFDKSAADDNFSTGVYNEWYCWGWDGETMVGTPAAYALEPVYPNPFNPTAVISFELRAASEIKLAVYDIAGREIEVLGAGCWGLGKYSVVWDASSQSSGVYFVRLETKDFTQTQKMLLVK